MATKEKKTGLNATAKKPSKAKIIKEISNDIKKSFSKKYLNDFLK